MHYLTERKLENGGLQSVLPKSTESSLVRHSLCPTPDTLIRDSEGGAQPPMV